MVRLVQNQKSVSKTTKEEDEQFFPNNEITTDTTGTK